MGKALERRDFLHDEVEKDVMEHLPRECRVAEVIDAVDAQDVLHSARQKLEELGLSYAEAMGSYSWLFYLRRTPDDLTAGRLGTTGPYRMQLAELLSALTPTDDYFTDRRRRLVVPPLRTTRAEKLVRLCILTGALATVHAVLRRAGKGQKVQLFEDALPWVVSDPILDDAIELYDNRVDASGGGIWSGTRPSTFHPFFVDLSSSRIIGDFLLSVKQLDAVQDVPVWDGPVQEAHNYSIRPGRFIVGGETLDETSQLFRRANLDSAPVPPGLSSLILLLRTLFSLAFYFDYGFGQSLPLVGYVVLPTNTLIQVLQLQIDTINRVGMDLGPFLMPKSGDVAFSEIMAIRPQLWPLERGPVVRMAGEQTVIDVCSASQRLHRFLTVTNSAPSSLVNARAADFERLVQAAIDNSPWRPPPQVGSLRGRTLRIDGKSVTDVDAIAVHGRVLLLVSCKSIPHTPELDAGIYARVRNVRTHLEQSDAEWGTRISKLNECPRGDNYDFSEFKILGMVCTPFVEFTYRDQARVVLSSGTGKHMRAVMGLAEFETFLNADGG